MRFEDLKKLNEARATRKAVVTVTDLATGEAQVLVESGSVGAPLGEAVAKALRSGKAGAVDVEGQALFLNVYLPPPRIVVIGAVHISQALARLAPVAGYDLTIIDPRTAFATEERFEGVELVADWPEDVLKQHPLDAYTALAAVTHDPKIDDFPLSQALKSGCFYVGALGSRKTHAKRVERLMEMGHSEEEITRIAAPIGLDIGAATPAEIALSTLAQIVQAFRRRDLVTGR
ncbi:XdhC family protein [Neorhizobium lilium]|uniref:XdhC family protein n=1 Tax=Neorhizobium lilium TaxID=2503024 RepID=A0A3S3SV22_9HYPH|nr:XdhC family protein [Neorhizobium lilium]RWX75463.1 XdhC family protein [Neorhizobium lilium]